MPLDLAAPAPVLVLATALGSYMDEDMTPEVAMLTGLARRGAPPLRIRTTPDDSVLMADGGRDVCVLPSRLRPSVGEEAKEKAGSVSRSSRKKVLHEEYIK